jgi:hypothetical protein
MVGIPGELERAERLSVEGALERDDRPPAAEEDVLERDLHGLGAAVREEHAVPATREAGGELPREGPHRALHVHRAAVAQIGDRRLHQLRMVVAEEQGPVAPHEVEDRGAAPSRPQMAPRCALEAHVELEKAEELGPFAPHQ